MHFVPDVEGDEQCGHGLDDAGVLQLAAVDGAHTGNLHRQLGSNLASIVVVAADDDVAIDVLIAVQHRGGKTVEGGRYGDVFADNLCRLLRRRTLPDTENAGRASTDGSSEWNGCVNQNG